MKLSAIYRALLTSIQKPCLRLLGLTHLSFLILAMVFLAGIVADTCLGSEGTEETTEFAPGILIVKFAEGVKTQVEKKEGCVATGISSVDALNRKHGVREFLKIFSPEPKSEKGRISYRELGLDRVYRFAALPEADVQVMVAEYEADPNVEYAEPDYVGHGHYTPNDPGFGVQWGLCNTGSNPPNHPGTADADVDATEVWDSWTPYRVPILAILDTGVDLDHPDLRQHPYNPMNGNIWFNYYELFGGTSGVDDDGNGYVDDCWGFDFVNGTQSGGLWHNDADGPQDDHGHGTVNAGIAGACTDNARGVAGLASHPLHGLWIMAVKVLDNNNWGLYSWWEEGLYYAANYYGTHVINMSMGGTSFSSTLQSAVDYAWSQGCVVVASMGNNNSSTPQYPAAFTNTIAVGATDTDDTRCNPADWGTGSGSNFGSHIDVVAPGNWIYSTAWNDSFAYWSGTSMAAPFVSALAGIIMTEQHPEPSPDEVREFIRSTAEDQVGLWTEDTPGWDQYYGWGRINAYAALQALPASGDANGDGEIGPGDVVFLLNYLYRFGPPPSPMSAGDANGDGTVGPGDVVYLLNYLYRGGPAPCPPRPRGSQENVVKSSTHGHAQVSLILETKPNSSDLEEVTEISVKGKYDRDVAMVHLEIEFDPDEVTLLEPVLAPISQKLQLFSGTENGIQKMGMVDLTCEEYLAAGEGTLLKLRSRGENLSSIRIKNAILVGRDAMRLNVDYAGELKLQESAPQSFSLSQNYPNPFNPQTTISYSLSKDAHVCLSVYNILGQKVKTLLDKHQSAGVQTVSWDGTDENGNGVSSGVYFYKLESDRFSETKKMLLMK